MSDFSASVLVISIDAPADNAAVSYVTTPNRERSLELLKLLQVDLLVVPAADSFPMARFTQLLRRVAPHLKWVLVGPDLSEADELAARCGGVVAVLDAPGDWSEIEAVAVRVALRKRGSLPASQRAVSLAR